MNFAQQLKTHRERLGQTQAELASFLEVSPRAVWQWEKGKLPHILTQEAALARLSWYRFHRVFCRACGSSGTFVP